MEKKNQKIKFKKNKLKKLNVFNIIGILLQMFYKY